MKVTKKTMRINELMMCLYYQEKMGELLYDKALEMLK